MSGIKLKPCPFCGGEAEAVYAPNDINRWGVQCKSCGCTVEVEEWKGVEDTKENAIKAWNRRTYISIDNAIEIVEKGGIE